MRRQKIPIAAFDLDGTCIDGQSGSLISLYLLAHDLMGIPHLARLAWWGARYTLHMPFRQKEAREVIFSSLIRHDPRDVMGVIEDFHHEMMLPLYRPEALAEVRRCKEEGCVTLLVSAAFHEVARCAACHLGTDDVIATRMDRDELGFYTGIVAGEVVEGREKVEAVVRWADERLGTGNWYLAHAYGDHYTDSLLLTAARCAFAVRPGLALRRIARNRNWTILEWGAARGDAPAHSVWPEGSAHGGLEEDRLRDPHAR